MRSRATMLTLVWSPKADRWTSAVVGMVMDRSEEQSAKAKAPIAVVEEGMLMDTSDTQCIKATSPIAVTDEGMLMDTSEEQ